MKKSNTQQQLSVKQRVKLELEQAEKNVPLLHYVAIYSCDNCFEYNILTIPCGIKVNDYAEKVKCKMCKCNLKESD